MSVVSIAKKLWHAVKHGLHFAHKLCYFVDRMDARIQASTASDGIKTSSAALKTSTHAFCEALQAYKETISTN